MSLERHAAFLQADRNPYVREGGLHAVLQALFPVEREAPRMGLSYVSYELAAIDDAGMSPLYVTFQLAQFDPSGSIGKMLEESILLGLVVADAVFASTSHQIGTGETPEGLAQHVTALLAAMAARARERIVDAGPDALPSDLLV